MAVTSLKNSGPGTLRAALEGGNRQIIFKVGGVILLKGALILQHPHVTIDGQSAPVPGISVEKKPFVIANTHDVILRHLRFRESDDDNLRITGSCRNIVVDHCSSTRAGDGAIDITVDYKTKSQPRDVTVSWCLLGGTDKAMLVASASKVTFHHNLFTNNGQRNPQLHDVEQFDFRNNVVRAWSVYGMRIRSGSTGNVVGNVFGPSSRPSKRSSLALIVAKDTGGGDGPSTTVFVSGNMGPKDFDPNNLSTARQPLEAPKVDTFPLARVQATVLENAGARPLDKIDRQYVGGSAELKPRPARTK